ncbi:MAG: quinoprotein relay system zinc metallohydrolase 2 [Rhizobiales bacterium]|nr:quinoprotein relay system zinc metallohydrolase 2 [Hyphomicrobiales bacterium]
MMKKLDNLPLFACYCLIAALFFVPLSAALAKADVEPLAVVEVGPGIFVAPGAVERVNPENQGHIANLGFIIGEKSVAVIDTGGSLLVGQRLRAAIEAKTDLPIGYVINTHAHPDHILGNAAFVNSGAVFVSHPRFNDALALRGSFYLAANLELIGKAAFSGSGLIPSTQSAVGEMTIDLGNRVLMLESFPTAHTDNDLIVVDRKTSTAFLGDLLFIDHVPALDGSIKGWLAVMARLTARPFAHVIAGHGPVGGPLVQPWPFASIPQKRYLELVASDVRRHIAAGHSLTTASKDTALSEEKRWLLFHDFNTRNATTTFSELEWE